MARRSNAIRLPKDIQDGLAADVATRYAVDVFRGKIPAGRLHIAACRRHLEDLRRRKETGWTWDLDLVLRFQAFCKLLPIPDKPGLRFELEPWQVFIAGSILGWRDAEGLRRYRRAYVEVARKNAKTMLLAVISLYLAFFDGEIRGEVYCCATTLDQAKLVYNYARDIVKQTPALRAEEGSGTIVEFGGDGPRAKPRLYDPSTGSILEPVASDSKKRDGYNPSAFVADELHEHKDSKLVDKLRTGQGARLQPLQLTITTAGDDQSSYCYRVRSRGVTVLEGTHADERAFFFVCHRDEADKWWTKKALQKANPNLGVSVQWTFLEDEVQRARSDPSEENTVRRMYLSDWVQQKTRVIALEKWDRCAGLPILEALKGRRAFGGLDLSRHRDMTAFVLLFPPEPGGPDEWPLLCWFWVPEEAARIREKRNIQNYDVWLKSGHLTVTEGDTIDFAAVKAKVVELTDVYDVALIGYDPWGATQLAQELELEHGLQLVKIRQSLEHMAEPSGKFLDLIKEKKLRHGGHPVLRWMAENAEKKSNSEGSWKFVKSADQEKKVDGIIAAVQALHCATLTPEAQTSVYESRGPQVLDGW